MALLPLVMSVAELREWFDQSEADEYGWVRVKLMSLGIRRSDHNTTESWIAITVESLEIDGHHRHIAGTTLEAHISIGTWTHVEERKWELQFSKALKRLKEIDSLDMHMRLNLEFTSDTRLVFAFRVNSTSCSAMESMEQVLSAGGAVLFGTHRGRSPPGPVFHLSVNAASNCQ